MVYRLVGILGSVGHRVKIHKITPPTGKDRKRGESGKKMSRYRYDAQKNLTKDERNHVSLRQEGPKQSCIMVVTM